MRVIDADALLIEMGAGCLPIMEKGISGVTGDEDTIKDYVDRAPTIDAEPVRHGRWNSVTVSKKYGGIVIQCSECGMKGTRIWNFCPNCGTKMDEEVEV